MHALIALITAAESGAEESSKTAFYICGGLLAAWAVVLSLHRDELADLPGHRRREARRHRASRALFVVAAMATAVITA